ncbi:hypothetical protein S141_57 [Shewanella sp. phage 1/41]|uniref:hypothetical protein n=1 Tax=Shewanella sp. phage 1/41 TaxID=1458861 RepID=UPI0004F67B54|nr:hypothetical protein S141_57 [Shewanella sp. phage 1/41]AHK11703.1 hypothetical protein S141_57 [Shewanella sp. phage 1/41]
MANETKYFKTPFAESGTRTEVPNASVGGAVGFDTGFGSDYELPQGSAGRKRIERDKYNGLHHSITKNLKQWQEKLYPTWIEDAGSVTPFSYAIGMVVNHAGNNWISTDDANTDEPGVGLKWKAYNQVSDFDSVDDMLDFGDLAVGERYCTGGTTWKYNGFLLGNIADFEPISYVLADDFGAVGDGLTDSTVSLNAALSTGHVDVRVKSGGVYITKGAILYTRQHQYFNLQGSTLKLIDYINDAGRNVVIEQESYSGVINGIIDGNYQNNNFDMSTWVNPSTGRIDINETPTAWGVYMSRYATNGNVLLQSDRASVKNIKIVNTIRSNLVTSGVHPQVDNVETVNSLCDHLVYMSNSYSPTIGSLILRGFCVGEAIAVSTVGEGLDVHIDHITMKAVYISPWQTQSSFALDKYDPKWMHVRANSGGFLEQTSVTVGTFDIDDEDSLNLFDSNRGLLFYDCNVQIDTLNIKTKAQAISTVSGNMNFILAFGGGTVVNISNMIFKIDDATAYPSFVSLVNPRSDATVNIGSLFCRVSAPNYSDFKYLNSNNANITVNTLNTTQGAGTLAYINSTDITKDSSISINKIVKATGATKYFDAVVPIENTGITMFSVFSSGSLRYNSLSIWSPSNHPSAFNKNLIDTGTSSGGIQYVKDGYPSQELLIKWGGIASKVIAGSSPKIQWISAETPVAGSYSTLRLNDDGVDWVEIYKR